MIRIMRASWLMSPAIRASRSLWPRLAAEALALATEFSPTAISLDVFLPDMLGWTVLNHLKQTSGDQAHPGANVDLDEDRNHGLARGAFAYLTKPITPAELEEALSRIKEYATPQPQASVDRGRQPGRAAKCEGTAQSDDIDITIAVTGTEALAILGEHSFDCMVLDLAPPDMSGFDVLERLRDIPSLSDLPVVVFTGKELSPEEDARLHALARSVVVKGVESPERLLDETAPLSPPGGRESSRRRSNECWTGCTTPMTPLPARRCWSWMTMSVTSSRSAASWSVAA